MGRFHETLIPERDFVATLVIEGLPSDCPPLALEEHSFPQRIHRRVAVDPATTDELMKRLRSRLELR
jgi:hypothetical protein